MNNKGFMIVELLMAAAIIALLAANIAVPAAFRHVEAAQEKICAETRRVTEHAELNYFMDTGEHSTVLQDLVDAGYLKKLPKCPAKGVYAWKAYPADDPAYHTVLVCSVHGVEGEEIVIAEPAPEAAEPPGPEPEATEPGEDKEDKEDKEKKEDKQKKK